jgi:hypothetical protein
MQTLGTVLIVVGVILGIVLGIGIAIGVIPIFHEGKKKRVSESPAGKDTASHAPDTRRLS